jgi:hypothetical protein
MRFSLQQRVICQVEGISLHTAVSKAPTEEGAVKLTDATTVRGRRSSFTRTKDQLITQKKVARGLMSADDNVS